MIELYMCDFPSSIAQQSVSSFEPQSPAPVESQAGATPRLVGSSSSSSLSDVHLETRLVETPVSPTDAFITAIEEENIQIIQNFLQNVNFDPNLPNTHNIRPLEVALERKNYEIIRLLLRHPGMDINQINLQKLTDLESHMKFKPLLTNLRGLYQLSEKINLSKDDLKSAQHLHALSALFPLKEDSGQYIPDQMWAMLEKAWEAIVDRVPDYFKDPIQNFIHTIHVGRVADATAIAQSIRDNKPVSFIVQLPHHTMSVSIDDDVLIFTNLGGDLNLQTGEKINGSILGKRMIHLNVRDKELLTTDFIQSLQACEDRALEKVFQMSVLGYIQCKGQKRGNCAGTHPKSIWEDQLLFAQIQELKASSKGMTTSSFFQALFKKHPIINHEKLIESPFRPAYQTFKALTLAVRKQILDEFESDQHVFSFLCHQVKTSMSDEKARLHITQFMNEVKKIAQETIQKMETHALELEDHFHQKELVLAVERNQWNQVRHLLNQTSDIRWDIHAVSDDGDTALALVIQSMIHVFNSNSIGYSAHEAFVDEGEIDLYLNIIDALIKRGADINAVNNDDDTLLMVAIKSGHIKVIQALLDRGADIHAVNDDGDTDLMLSIQRDINPNVIQILLDQGADIHAVNNDGDTALMLASKMGNQKVIQILTQLAANKNI